MSALKIMASGEGRCNECNQVKYGVRFKLGVGDTARGESTPLHRGRTTMVWQTKITRGDGRLAALVTQTQMVIGSQS